MNTETVPIDFQKLREGLSKLEGRRYWRSLEELAETPAFTEMLQREFPQQASEWADPVGRRRFLQLMGASLAFAGLTACSRPPTDKIVPYVKQPEDLLPGRPLFYATAVTLGGIASGVLVKSEMGRPIKVEGNPDHPASLGATDVFAQASILGLYDPDRSRTVTHAGDIRPYADFLGALRGALSAQKGRKGAGLRLLTGSVSSPTLAARIADVLAAYPLARWHQYEPAGRDTARAGAIAAFGEDAEAIYRFDRADVVLSLDADFLGEGPGHVRYVRDFTSRRRPSGDGGGMNRLYVVESMPSPTGAMADHRWPLRPSEIPGFARAVAAALSIDAGAGSFTPSSGESIEAGPGGSTPPSGVPAHALAALVRDLRKSSRRALVLAGREQPPFVHAAAHAINQALGNAGTTVHYTDPVEARSVHQGASIRDLVSDMEAGRVDLLMILGGNPAYDTPADLRFAKVMEKVALRVHLGLYDDETSARSHWHVPQAHELESWGDARAYDGTVTILQPLIEPLYGGRTAHELLEVFSAKPVRTSRDIVREHWSKAMAGGGEFESAWNRALHDGIVAGTALPIKSVSLKRNWWNVVVEGASSGSATGNDADTRRPGAGTGASAANDARGEFVAATGSAAGNDTNGGHHGVAAVSAAANERDGSEPGAAAGSAAADDGNRGQHGVATGSVAANDGDRGQPGVVAGSAPVAAGLEVAFRPDPSVYDGRFTNNGWLQEMARPITKLTWDNAALVSPRTAERLGLANEDLVDLGLGGRSVRAPVWITPGHADETVTVHLGYGRSRTGRAGSGTGFNAYAIRSSAAPWMAYGLTLRRTGARYPLATTQTHHSMEGREPVRSGTLAEFVKDPQFAHRREEAPADDLTMYPAHEYKGHAWGLAIDLSACVGCNACAVACQSENNIPIVGKEQVARGREMHWIRIDRYFEGSLENPETWHQPVMCMHCENAPCELVCPVAATVHSSEGLNDMVYNRCVGTRYCANNCPYKVRRFNFLQFADFTTPSLQLLHNPDVTVRTRGVMEKCTYCVQRINHARNDAEVEGRPIRDGEIVTACQQACPAGAIVFGDINDPASRVSKMKADPRNYGLLEELNTRPRTSYLAALRNPNPEIEKGGA